VLTIEAARLAARQKDSAGDLLSVPGVKIRGQPVRGPGPQGWLPYRRYIGYAKVRLFVKRFCH